MRYLLGFNFRGNGKVDSSNRCIHLIIYFDDVASTQ